MRYDSTALYNPLNLYSHIPTSSLFRHLVAPPTRERLSELTAFSPGALSVQAQRIPHSTSLVALRKLFQLSQQLPDSRRVGKSPKPRVGLICLGTNVSSLNKHCRFVQL